MSIIKSNANSNKAPSNVTKFTVRLDDSNSLEFRPTVTFAHIEAAQVLKIILNAEVATTAENNRGKVNFKLQLPTKSGALKNAAFINYFDNDLTDESTDKEVNVVIADVKTALSTVTIDDITLPMTANEADDLIAGL